MRAVLVANPKGGCGKTTLAVNLAGCLAARTHGVILWDLDRQKSALEWLALRSPELPAIHSLTRDDDEPSAKQRRKHEWLILDSPAGLHGKNLAHAVKPVDKILIPIQPSLFDMAALRDFLAVLHEEHLLRKARHRQTNFVGIIGMRVDPRTRAANALEVFLKQFDFPVLAYLRDTQLYANAAFQGKSIFDLPHYLSERDVAEWAPIARWVDA
jgi:chromosome partitioning protein